MIISRRFCSRESRKSRESSVPMNMPHTDLTNLTEAASQKARSYHPACTLGAADSKGEATCLREICEICVRPKSMMQENFAFFARFACKNIPRCKQIRGGREGSPSYVHCC